MSLRQVFGLFLIIIGVVLLVHADDILKVLSGSCRITASIDANQFELKLERGQCFESRECNTSTFTEPASAFTGFALSGLTMSDPTWMLVQIRIFKQYEREGSPLQVSYQDRS